MPAFVANRETLANRAVLAHIAIRLSITDLMPRYTAERHCSGDAARLTDMR